MGATKMTVKIYRPLMEDFNRQVDSLHLMRDAFVNSMIRQETRRLAEEMHGKKMSAAARAYVAGSLKHMGTKPVNLVVDKDTADALNKVVAETNMVRDAFINRLIMFLRSSDSLLKYLELPSFITGSEFQSSVEPMPTSPLKAIEAVHADPLYYLRVAIEERHETGLYLMNMPPKLVGFSCYLDDASVPGTPSFEEKQREVEEMLRELDVFETEAFASTKEKGKGT
jgi:hypothetical protein